MQSKGKVEEIQLVDGRWRVGREKRWMDGRKVGMTNCGLLGRGRHPNSGEEGTGSWKGEQWL